MKIEKLSKDNIKEFIRDMKIEDSSDIELNVDKRELFGIKMDDTFCLGFKSLSQMDTVAILYFAPRLSSEAFYECILFMDKSLVVNNHLIIDVYDKRYMKLLDEKYKCREITVSLAQDGHNFRSYDIFDDNIFNKEKIIDIEMKSIKYYVSKNLILCNLVKQNIQDEKIISDLHNSFKDNSVDFVGFNIFPDSLDYFKTLGYQCVCKSYVIRNELF